MKNTLMQYEGGGYSGCIWEWNMCYWDSEGIWHNIYESGYAGCKTEDKALRLIDGKEDRRYHLYDLDNESKVKDFIENSNSELVLGTIRHLNKNGYDLEVICSDCGNLVSPEFCILEDWHGCGGIASTADKIVCEDCHGRYSCSECGEYFGKDYKFKAENTCKTCAEGLFKKKIETYSKRENTIFLKYNEFKNIYEEIEPNELEVEDNLIVVEVVENKIGFPQRFEYIVNAETSEEALQMVSDYLEHSHLQIAVFDTIEV